MTEMLKRLVIEHKLVDYQYFMDNMQLYEIILLDELIPFAERISYEQMRLLMWSNFKSTGCKVPKPEKLLPLTTDTETNIAETEYLNKQQIDVIKEQIKHMFKSNGKQS